MEYVILGAGAAGITAAKTIRKADSEGKITVISTDTQVHSRCMLHKYLSHERDAEGISFIDPDFFEKNQITWLPGKTVNRLDTQGKKVYTDQGDEISYDRLLIATGAESFIPPVGNLREAENVFGLRHLRDAQAIDALAKDAENIVIIGSGLVGLDAAYGLMETGKKVSIVEMADQILPVQLDKTAASEYQKRFEKAGAVFYLGKVYRRVVIAVLLRAPLHKVDKTARKTISVFVMNRCFLETERTYHCKGKTDITPPKHPSVQCCAEFATSHHRTLAEIGANGN